MLIITDPDSSIIPLDTDIQVPVDKWSTNSSMGFNQI